MQHGLLAAYDECMPGIVAALKPNDALSVISKPIHDFALALVAPLSSDDNYIFNHVSNLQLVHCRTPAVQGKRKEFQKSFLVLNCIASSGLEFRFRLSTRHCLSVSAFCHS